MSKSDRSSWGVVPGLLLLTVTVLMVARPASSQYREAPYTTVDFGSGYGAMALSMGGAFIADGKGLAAAGYNPAGLARLTGFEMNVGAGLGGQYVSAPYGPNLSGFTLLPIGGPYDWRFSRASLRHAGAAVVLKGGGRIVLGVSYHREVDSRASFAYSIERDGPAQIYDPAISSSVISGTAQQSEEYRVHNSGGWDVITGSLAFRILKNVYFGANLNCHKGLYRRSTVSDYSLVFSSSGVSLTGQGSIIDEFSSRDATSLNADIGIQWVTKFCSAGFVLRTGSRVDYMSDHVDHESLTYSSGTVLLDDYRNQYGGESQRPTRYGLGLSLHPWRRLTASVDYETSEKDDAIGFPGVWDQLRTGAEFLLPLPGLELPVRAGWFSVKTDIYEPGGWAWMRAFTFGTGLTWRNMVLDVGAVLHSKSLFYGASANVERSAWEVVTTLTLRWGK